MRQLLKEAINQFYVITTGSLIGAAVFTSVFQENIDRSLLWQILIVSLLAACLNLIFYSKQELSKMQRMKRQVIHYLGIMGLLLSSAIGFTWIELENSLSVLVMSMIVTGVYVFVCLVVYQRDEVVTEQLNRHIEAYKKAKIGNEK